MTRAKHELIDLEEGVECRVRLYRYTDGGEPVAEFEGTTTFTISDDVPLVRRLGPRWRIAAACLPDREVITGELPSCRPGDPSIEFGEQFSLWLLDRKDPAHSYCPAGPTRRDALEMHLSVFEVTEGVEVRFR